MRKAAPITCTSGKVGAYPADLPLGKSVDEVGSEAFNSEPLVRIDARDFDPNEVDPLRGGASNSNRILGRKHKVSFPQPVSEILSSDLKSNAKESHLREFGHG
jgi:GDP-D-mannose dehydratase